MGFAESGNWGKVAPVAAAFAGGLLQARVTATERMHAVERMPADVVNAEAVAAVPAAPYPELLGGLSSRDRAVYTFNWGSYLAAIAAGGLVDPLAITKNPMAVSLAKEEGTRSAAGMSSGRWRLQREKKSKRNA